MEKRFIEVPDKEFGTRLVNLSFVHYIVPDGNGCIVGFVRPVPGGGWESYSLNLDYSYETMKSLLGVPLS